MSDSIVITMGISADEANEEGRNLLCDGTVTSGFPKPNLHLYIAACFPLWRSCSFTAN